MEAAACGVPAVATAVGGIPEMIEEGVTGLLAAPGNRKSVAKHAKLIEIRRSQENWVRPLAGGRRAFLPSPTK